MRSKDINVAKLALEYQGGGHKTAAGFEVSACDPLLLRDEIVEKIKGYVKQARRQGKLPLRSFLER